MSAISTSKSVMNRMNAKEARVEGTPMTGLA